VNRNALALRILASRLPDLAKIAKLHGMSVRRTFVGTRLRALRDEHRLTQAALATRLGISASYLNQLEHNQRPLTAALVRRLQEAFDVEIGLVAEADHLRLVAELHGVLAADGFTGAGSGSAGGSEITAADLDELAATQPAVARALVALHRRHRAAVDQAVTLSAGLGAGLGGDASTAWPVMPFEEVRDFVYEHRNHFPTLDEPAERLAAERELVPGQMDRQLTRVLATEHRIKVRTTVAATAAAAGATAAPDPDEVAHRRYDPQRRVLELDGRLLPGQRAFHMATQLALLRFRPAIDELVAGHPFSGDEARGLARIALASYVAGAVLMPYRAFLDAAEAVRYDVEALGDRFGVGFEKVCHRLASLQRPGARGVPFLFVRVDRAGNISKRQSATDFHLSRVGGSCPLWVLHDAFSTPDRIVTQLAEMPDGRRYLWLARTVTDRHGPWGTPTKTFAIGLGCDVDHAHRLVYSRGLDLTDPRAADPIGPGCRLCERPACPQRAFPAVGRPLRIDEHRSTYAAYTTA
jgi:hypothetical protein